MDEMYHHGILGQKWGVRRFQNKDGTLTAAGQKRLEKKDAKWAHRNHDKIVSKARKDVSKELDQYANQLLKNPSSVTSKGKISSSAINSYNRKMAELMNEKFVQFSEPEQLEEYLFTACGQTAVLYHAELAAALALLPEQAQEEIFRYYFLRQPQRVIGVHIGRTRSTAGRHIQLALQRLRKEMEVSRYE